MKKVIILLLFCLLFIGSINGKQASLKFDKPFKLKKSMVPDYLGISISEQKICSDIENGFSICKHISKNEIYLAVERNGKLLGRWNSIEFNGGQFTYYDVLIGDLDNDGLNEITIANKDGISNGLGIHYWTIFILLNPLTFGFHQPLEFKIEEYGSNGSFIKQQGDSRCNIFATEWQFGGLKESKRNVDGLYLMGRWFHYQSGRLKPTKRDGVLAKRYLFSFQEERLRTLDDLRIPFLWFKHGTIQHFTNDPVITKEVSRIDGKITNILGANQNPLPNNHSDFGVRVKTRNGRTIELFYSESESKEIENTFFRFGDNRTKIIYPKSYQPSHIGEWLIGKPIQVSTYEDKYSAKRRIIWVNE